MTTLCALYTVGVLVGAMIGLGTGLIIASARRLAR